MQHASQQCGLRAVVGGNAEMMRHAIDYMRFRCLANPFVLTNFVLIGTFRGVKDAKTPLYAALLANIANATLVVLFVYGLNMGAAGAAFATSLSQMLSCCILFGILVRRCALRCPRLSRGSGGHTLRVRTPAAVC
jgi:Na+-driven multidrug efflux pump